MLIAGSVVFTPPSQPVSLDNQFNPNGKYMGNTFQGTFPNNDSKADGFVGIAPIK